MAGADVQAGGQPPENGLRDGAVVRLAPAGQAEDDLLPRNQVVPGEKGVPVQENSRAPRRVSGQGHGAEPVSPPYVLPGVLIGLIRRPADETYEHAWEYVWRGHRLRAVALPGHTPGSAGIFLDGDTFFSGDYLIPGEEVILRLPGGSETDYRAVTEPVLRGLPPGLHICPGHGEPYILKGKE